MMIRLADVCRTKAVTKPVEIPLLSTIPATSAVISVVPFPRVRHSKLSACAAMPQE